MALSPLHHILIALGLGLLVGVVREHARSRTAGIRTFPLITVLGAAAAHLGDRFGGWIVVAGLLAVGAMVVMGNVARIKEGDPSPGITSEIATLVMYTAGSLVGSGLVVEAIVLSGAVSVLLHFKARLHGLVAAIGEADLRAMMQFVLLALVILPLLPDESFGPYRVLNPFRIWLIVVLIVGISLSAYVAYKLLGARVGAVLAGALGGLISSTATTVSVARRTREVVAESAAGAVVVILASTVVFGRVLLEVAVVAPGVFPDVAPPLAAMGLVMVGASAASYWRARGELVTPPEGSAPTSLLGAILFGALYAAILLAVAFAKDRLGVGGLYVVAALSGLTDMDAITLSTAELVRVGQLPAREGWRLILVGGLANLLFKGGAVATLGHPRLLRRIAVPWAVALVLGAAIIAVWPG